MPTTFQADELRWGAHRWTALGEVVMTRSIRVVVCQGDSEVQNKVCREDEVNFGKRELSNQIVLNAQGVSRNHATITRSAEGLVLCDTKSTNGTYVDGERVERFVLKGGESIAIGPFQLRVFDEEDPETQEDPGPSGIVKEKSEFLNLIEIESVGNDSFDSLAPIEIPETPCEEPDLEIPATTRSHAKPSLALVYREAADRCGSPKWGYPGSEPDNETLVFLQQQLAHTELEADAKVEWYHRINCELSGGGPLLTLLAEAAFDQLTICGTHPIEVEREGARESLPIRYSCHEALAADLHRLLGDVSLREDNSCQVGNNCLRVIGNGLVDGLGIVVRRAERCLPPRASDELFEGAKTYIDGLVHHNCSVLVVGGSTVDLGVVQAALLGRIPGKKSVTVVSRGGNVQDSKIVRVDGFRAGEQVWRAVSQLNRSWLFVESLSPTDISSLAVLGRHSGGGTIATIQASSLEIAFKRLEAYSVCAGLVNVAHAECFVHQLFDSAILVHAKAQTTELLSVAEPRSSGELVEIFARDESGLHETGVESIALK